MSGSDGHSEQERLRAAATGVPWKKWGPYLSERQWGTVREDYSADGNAWKFFTHDQARSRTYRWGEDGLGGISDDKQRLCFALALWNGKDPILKERLFGLDNSEGNHGEDVKEYYYYLDSTPTHSYLKFLYKYPHSAYPYNELVAINRQRGRQQPEYELIDTGVFDEDRYFDLVVEYAKATPEDILIRISAVNRGPEAARLHLLPTLWFRNTWSWGASDERPWLHRELGPAGVAVRASHLQLGERWLYGEEEVPLLFTENDSNAERLFGQPNPTPYVKDAFHNYLVHGRADCVNPMEHGTKAALHFDLTVPPAETRVVRLRLSEKGPHDLPHAIAGSAEPPFGAAFDELVEIRRQEADAFYAALGGERLSEDEALIMRQALAGMLWTKQYYYFDADRWLEEHGSHPYASVEGGVRNWEWFHMVNEDLISMPDKWEYPWYAAWDLAFQSVPLAMVDIDFAKQQLELLLRDLYLHPNGQIPAYEWNFSDVNPPVHALAVFSVYHIEKQTSGTGDLNFLKRCFDRLLMNFTWWVNRKDRNGKNIFEGGFLGLDNIGVFDRSSPLPTGGYLEQADGTAWMALYCQAMLEIATELALDDPTYEPLLIKFTEHFLWIAMALNHIGVGQEGLWDEADGFYYDHLRFPDGRSTRLHVRSMVGLLPLCATTVIEPEVRDRFPSVVARIRNRVEKMPKIFDAIHPTGPGHLGVADRGILALVGPERLRRILARMLDENEFLSPYGIRALSRHHADHPYVFWADGEEFRVSYLPGESDSGMFGGNSNWRGPIWFPVNFMLLRALQQFYLYYGDDFKVECPTGSGVWKNLFEVVQEISERLLSIFARNAACRRPVFGDVQKFQQDPHWRDHLLFYEYFHGDSGAGLGASHQTGWTGLVARIIYIRSFLDGECFLAGGKFGGMVRKS